MVTIETANSENCLPVVIFSVGCMLVAQ